MVDIRRAATVIEEVFEEAGLADGDPLRRVAVLFALRNPYVNAFHEKLDAIMDMGCQVAEDMVRRLLVHFDGRPECVEGYGKAVIVGRRGEIEHGHALVTRPFGSTVRRMLGATAWMCCNVKRGELGHSIDVPIAYKNALAVRSHYDTMPVAMADAPLENELLVVLAGTSRGRLHARTGGLRAAEVVGRDVYVDRPEAEASR